MSGLDLCRAALHEAEEQRERLRREGILRDLEDRWERAFPAYDADGRARL